MGPYISNDLDRMAGNQKALLEAMPEMVLLINIDGSIEHMNPSARSFFGELCCKKQKTDFIPCKIHDQLIALAKVSIEKKSHHIETTLINDSHLQYSVAPFSGYKGDKLYWLIIRDITENTKDREELCRHNNSIESVLAYKINELKESKLVKRRLSKQLENIKISIDLQSSSGMIVGASRAMQDFQNIILRVADTDATIMITGESGTGKELAANMLYEASGRKDQPYLKINCNTINDMLLESDLFGYEKGAFTGAEKRQQGKFEAVNGGTIFLDEIGDISPRMQAALLRVLQNGEIFRVGGNVPIKIDVRIIAATNMDLPAAVQKGSFRLDLFYRLNIINLPLPPLRERKEDINALVSHFVRVYREKHNKEIQFIPKQTLEKLMAHDWPGNIRELENVIQRAVLMCKSDIITNKDLIFDIQTDRNTATGLHTFIQQYTGMPLKKIVSELEKKIIEDKLGTVDGNVAMTAKELQICKAALYEKLKRYSISPKELR